MLAENLNIRILKYSYTRFKTRYFVSYSNPNQLAIKMTLHTAPCEIKGFNTVTSMFETDL